MRQERVKAQMTQMRRTQIRWTKVQSWMKCPVIFYGQKPARRGSCPCWRNVELHQLMMPYTKETGACCSASSIGLAGVCRSLTTDFSVFAEAELRKEDTDCRRAKLRRWSEHGVTAGLFKPPSCLRTEFPEQSCGVCVRDLPAVQEVLRETREIGRDLM
ncbi:hypothetical protein AOLI_G00193170 [Acnodon oligacanthus]